MQVKSMVSFDNVEKISAVGDEAIGDKRNLKMVWGLVEPSGFGDFFQGGDYVGWEETIKRYFDEEMTAEQRAAFDNWDVNFRGEVGRKFVEDKGPLEPHECPAEFRLRSAHKSLGSLVVLLNRLLAVDASLKETIERLEPGVHQFWPLRITVPKGQDILLRIMAWSFDASSTALCPNKAPGIRRWSERNSITRSVLRKRVLVIWR